MNRPIWIVLSPLGTIVFSYMAPVDLSPEQCAMQTIDLMQRTKLQVEMMIPLDVVIFKDRKEPPVGEPLYYVVNDMYLMPQFIVKFQPDTTIDERERWFEYNIPQNFMFHRTFPNLLD